ncbi:MAG: RagB/SusD family nutrient uptake outer membrane protein [Daejeonella sp.]|uniref:RagB/SusD family nutrient uptake outer membrane protein n=1 Tax=Daejeonella sp. TaxID=2805397 RepID=UPI003C71E265
MKKKLIIYSITGASLFGFSGCEKKLDLQPEQSLSAEVALSSKETATSALLGVYSSLQTLEAFGGQPQIIGDYQADNVLFVGSFPTLQEITNYNVISSNATIETIWLAHYRAILRANKIIAKVPGVADVSYTDAQRKQAVAEAKFLRALTYFQLSNLFSQPFQLSGGTNLSVPLVLESFEGEISFPARATLNDVQNQIKKDLTEAIVDLPASYSLPADTRGRATKGAVQALLSRVHLYRNDWANAEASARQVLASPLYVLASNYSFYDGNTPEDVFSIQNSATDNGRTGSGGWASYYQPAAKGGRGDAPFSTSLVAAYNEEPGDKRFTSLNATGAAADGVSRPFTLKFPDAINNTDNSPIIRTTEVVLNLAEAIAEQRGINLESITLINQLRTRAGLPSWTIATFLTKPAFIDAILNERRKELAFEGHRRMDLLRKGKALRTTGPEASKATFGGNFTILPIPFREIDQNKALVQNPGY